MEAFSLKYGLQIVVFIQLLSLVFSLHCTKSQSYINRQRRLGKEFGRSFSFLPLNNNKIVKLFAGNVENIDRKDRIVIVGVAGSAAETTALKVGQLVKGLELKTSLILNRIPFSPLLSSDSSPIDIYVSDGESFDTLTPLKASKSGGFVSTSTSTLFKTAPGERLVVVAVGDPGDESLLTSAKDEDDKDKGAFALRVSWLFNNVNNILQGVVKSSENDISIICAASVDPETGVGLGKESGGFNIGGFLKSASSLSAAVAAFRSLCLDKREGAAAVFGLLRYGKLTGGVPGAEPLPFMSMPLLEPELHPSYTLNTVLLNPVASDGDSSKVTASMKNAASELCTRDSLAEAIVQLITRTSRTSSKPGGLAQRGGLEVDSFIQSIEGPASMSAADWDKVFARLMTSVSKAADVELLKMEFASVPKEKLQLFGSWLVDTWFPQALIEANAATILSGARPVRARKLPSPDPNRVDIHIAWEDLKPDLTVKPVGTVEISVSSEPPRLRVRRLTAGGELPGEEQLLDRLEEGIYKNAFKKQFCAPLVAASQ